MSTPLVLRICNSLKGLLCVNNPFHDPPSWFTVNEIERDTLNRNRKGKIKITDNIQRCIV